MRDERQLGIAARAEEYFRKWMWTHLSFNIIIYYVDMSTLKCIKIYARSSRSQMPLFDL